MNDIPMTLGPAPVKANGLPSYAHRSPRDCSQVLWRVRIAGQQQVEETAARAKRMWRRQRTASIESRRTLLIKLADLIEASRTAIVKQLIMDIGKPLGHAQEEVNRSIALLKTVVASADGMTAEQSAEPGERACRRPLGLIAIVTPWNNPLAIPIGKIAPAVIYGNAVLWKPAPAGSAIAAWLMDQLDRCNVPCDIISMINGDRSTAEHVMNNQHIDAISLSGSSTAGACAQAISARRRIPLQAELGGNNAAIVWSDCDLEGAAQKIVAAAFGFAGQRCTANRRVIIDAQCLDEFLTRLKQAADRLVWGDPSDSVTSVGPLISIEKRRHVEALIDGSTQAGGSVAFVHDQPRGLDPTTLKQGAYYPPTILCSDNPETEIVQEETFGPVLVAQPAQDWDHALTLCNGVKQGLVAALFSASRKRQVDFMANAQAGNLMINRATVGVGVNLPFGGWKSSGIGPPEHGSANLEAFTRAQSLYIGGR